jgi:hypothetical protein
MRGHVIVCVVAVLGLAYAGQALALPGAQALTTTSGANDRIRAVVQSAERVYVGGDFTRVDGKKKRRIAALRASDGKLRTKWRAQANGRVYALVLGDGKLFAAGAFTKVNGLKRRHVVALNPRNGRVLRWRVGTDATVRALAVRRRTLFLGGDFKTVAGKHRVRLAAVSTRSRQVRRWNGFANRAVWSLRVAGKRLFAGGDFTKVAGQNHNIVVREYFASFRTRRARLLKLNPGPGFPVRAIRTATGTVFLGTAGECNVGGTCNAALAYFTDTGALKWRCQTNGDVHALDRAGGVLYVGGHWTALVDCGAEPPSRKLMALRASNGDVLPWSPGSNGQGVLALAARGSRLAVGGEFTRVTGADHRNYAQFTGDLQSTS